MKRILLFAAAVALAGIAGLLPFEQRDVGDLLPVRALVVSREGRTLVLDGGKGLCGRGETWDAAMDDLRASAAGDPFFGCTGEVIFGTDAAEAMQEAARDGALRPAARVYLTADEPDPEEAADFLDAHPGKVTLQELRAAALEGRKTAPPLLICENGRYELSDG